MSMDLGSFEIVFFSHLSEGTAMIVHVYPWAKVQFSFLDKPGKSEDAIIV